MMLFSISYYRYIRTNPDPANGHVLDAPEVFYALALLSLPEFYLLRMFVRAWQRLQEFKASRARLDEFFSHPEPPAPPAEQWRRRQLLLGGGDGGGGDGSSSKSGGGGLTGGKIELEGGRFRWPKGAAAAAGSSKDAAPGGGSSSAAVSALGVEVAGGSSCDDDGGGAGGGFDSSTASGSVVLSFGSGAQMPAASGAALTDVRLELRPGELLGVCGSTGAGKTSLLACLLGELGELQDDGSVAQPGGGGGSGGAGVQGAAENGAAAAAGESPGTGGILVAGRTSFLAQQPWVAWGTLRENVVLAYPEEPDASHSQSAGGVSSPHASGYLAPGAASGAGSRHDATGSEAPAPAPYVQAHEALNNAERRGFGGGAIMEREVEYYNRVVEACALTNDLLTLTAGDLTPLGDGGSSLSGGQVRAAGSLPPSISSLALSLFMFLPLP
jgi:ABC-type multidrug transport system fused ATPase/permease subunit